MSGNKKKQPFANVFQNRCSKKFYNIHRKTPVLESLLNNVAGLRLVSTSSKTTCQQPRKIRIVMSEYLTFRLERNNGINCTGRNTSTLFYRDARSLLMTSFIYPHL